VETPARAPWIEQIISKFSARYRESAPGEPEFTVDHLTAHKLLSDLQNQGYVHLADLSAYDEFPKTPRFHVFYELISLKEKKRCAVIATLDNDNPEIVTVTDLWKGANWLERETYDMYGIIFDGHPDLRRILLPPSFKGWPLRKDFVVDYRQNYEKTTLEGVFDPFGPTIVKPSGAKT
jgi:NADH-quinone oxidoreductase subunit C